MRLARFILSIIDLPPLVVPLVELESTVMVLRSRWSVIQGTVRPYLIVFLAPFLNEYLRFNQCGKYLPIKKLIS